MKVIILCGGNENSRFCLVFFILLQTFATNQGIWVSVPVLSSPSSSIFAGKQVHHHNVDQAARRPHILCSICIHSFGALAKAVRLFMVSLQSSQMCSICIFVPNRLAEILMRDFSNLRFNKPLMGPY